MKSTDWKAGVGRTNITPTESMWLAGWAARREPAHAKATDLFTKALALQHVDGSRVLILTADLIAIPRTLARQVSERLRKRYGLARECILFNASHTHTGPEVRPDKVPFFEIPTEYAAKIAPFASGLVDKMVSAAAAALESLEEVTLGVRSAKVGFAVNRRNPGGPMDPDVPVLEVIRRDAMPLAVLFGFACHNLTLPPTFCQYHSEYAGVAQQYLEELYRGATALFLAGAGADQNPSPRGGPDWAVEHGRTLGEAVQRSLETPARIVSGRLSAGFREVPLDFAPLPSAEALAAEAQSDDPPRRRKAEFLLAALNEKRPPPASYPCPVQVLRVGKELLLIAIGGELAVEYALRFKAEFAGALVWVAGYSNDMFGYVPTRRMQQEGGYEGGRAMLWSALPGPFTETVEERVVGAVRELVEETKP